MAAGTHTLLSCLILLSMLGLSMCKCKSGQSCKAAVEDGKARSLLQVTQGYKAVEEHAQGMLAVECNWKCYIQRYPDLAGMDAVGAQAHYAQFGSKESRDCTCQPAPAQGAPAQGAPAQGAPAAECDWKCYIQRYDDLAGLDEATAQAHYAQFGSKEGRNCACPPVPKRPITFITNYDPSFETSLGKTSLWINRMSLPHQWILLNNTKNDCIGAVYADGQSQALHDLQVFLHSDVFLHEDFHNSFMEKLQSIETVDPNWGVLGTAGMDIYTQRENVSIRSSITDPHGAFDTGEDNLEVQSLDESLMVLRRASPKFDPALPGFDMYGTDIVLAAKQAGQKSYLLNLASVSHKTMNPEGDEDIQAKFIDKVNSESYEQRLDRTMTYFQKKWCPTGFLPVMAPVFKVECNHWESYIG